jgi:outer membrane protein assembly factor BamB
MVVAPGAWEGLGGSGTRSSSTPFALPSLSSVTWARVADADGNPISFIGQAPLAVSDRTVFAVGRVSPPGATTNQARLWAFSRDTGAVRWWAPLPLPPPSPVLDSASGPALDQNNSTVIFPALQTVYAFDQDTGALRWQTHVTHNIVNASVLVVPDQYPRGRAFITDYDATGGTAKLYCINTDPFDSAANPFQPGDLVWTTPIGSSSGNSPAYLARRSGGLGLVYVATVSGDESEAGTLLAFPADAVSRPSPVFEAENAAANGFYGALCVTPPAGPGADPSILCASYNFYGGLNSANLVKFNARTGSVRWSAACNRTNSIPVPLPGGRIALSTGIDGYGSAPSVELFQDGGNSAAMIWDSAVATWHDDNQNGSIDPGEYTPLGGWTQQPVACTFAGRSLLAVGLLPAGSNFSTPSNDLFVLDLDITPDVGLAFIAQHVTGVGGGPAFAGVNLYSVGTSGLVCFGPTPASLDVSGDRRIGIDDLYAWEEGLGARDINGDGSVTATDRSLLMNALRCGTKTSMIGDRP